MESIHPLKAWRDRQIPPLTQREAAKLLGVSEPTLSRWETGERKPSMRQLAGIQEKTGIAPVDLRPDMSGIFEVKEPEAANAT